MFTRAEVAFRRQRLNPVAKRVAPVEARRDYTAACIRELSLLANRPLGRNRRPRR